MQRQFRFAVFAYEAASRHEWEETARRVEALGYAILVMPDHFLNRLTPVPALAAVAAVTTTLRIGTIVFANDYRHPALLAKEAATLDLLSDGRFEFGLGAGSVPEGIRAGGYSLRSARTAHRSHAGGPDDLQGALERGAADVSGNTLRNRGTRRHT